ncbi:MAG TPA: DUF3367 domain-containing protein [bacterium]|nr:DUF3367 domain-containing protein [bacterium]
MGKDQKVSKKGISKLAQFISNNYLLIELALIILLGIVVPLLWFNSPTEYIFGHDANYPIDPQSWLESRVGTWSSRFNFGADQSFLLGRIFIFLQESVLVSLGLSIFISQRLVAVFWFLLPGISMYLLTRYLMGKSKQYSFFRVGTSLFYMMNHYLLQGWFIIEISKFSIIAAAPLVALFVLKGFDKKIKLIHSILAANLTLFFLNGGGNAFTLYGGLFLILISISLGYLVTKRIKLLRLLKYWLIFGLAFILLNSYWLIPLIIYSGNSFSDAISTFGGIENTLRWTKAISENASIGNILRLQGIPDWYDNTSHPYSSVFLNNSIFIITSFLIPISALFSFLIYRKKKDFNKNLVWLAILVVLGVIFTAGSHKPFENSFNFLLENVPYFTTFRSAYYKFGYSMWFAYSILTGLTINYVSRLRLVNFSINFPKIKGLGKINLSWEHIIGLGAMLIFLVYNFPFLTGSFFDWRDPYSTKLELPGYTFEYQDWARVQPKDTKTLVLPKLPEEDQIDSYLWGYNSLDPLPTLLSDRNIVLNNFELSTPESEKELVNLLYSSLESSPETFDSLSKMMGIDNILLRKDIDYLEETGKTIEDLEDNLDNSNRFSKQETWEQWVIYSSSDTSDLLTAYTNPVDIIHTEELGLGELAVIMQETKGSGFTITESSDKGIIFLDEQNIKKINPDNNSIAFDVKGSTANSELVLKRNEIGYGNILNVFLTRVDQYQYILTLKNPDLEVEYNETKTMLPGESLEIPFDANRLPNFGLQINNATFEVQEIVKGSEVGLGTIETDYGFPIVISIFSPENSEVLTTVQFEGSELGNYDQGQCGGTDQITEFNLENEGNNGYVTVTAKKNTIACLTFPVATDLTSSLYKLDFDYKLVKGENPQYCALQKGFETKCVGEGELSAGNEWQTFSNFVEVDEGTQELILHLYAISDTETTEVSYDNIKITRISKEDIISISQKNQGGLTEGDIIVSLEDDNIKEIRISSNILDTKRSTVPNPSFEDGLWGGVRICGREENKRPEVSAETSEDAYHEEKSLQISSSSGTACVSNEIINFSSRKVYSLKLNYKNISGQNSGICVLKQGEKGVCSSTPELEGNGWQRHSEFIFPDLDTQDLIIHLYSKSSNNQKSLNLYDNILLKSLYKPFELAYIRPKSKDTSPRQPGIETISHSPGNILLRIDNADSPFVLKYNQSHNTSWKALTTVGNRGTILDLLTSNFIPEEEHIKVDGYANGWKMDIGEIENTYVRIIYMPQIYFLAAIVVSLASLFIVVLAIAIFAIKRGFKDLKINLGSNTTLKSLRNTFSPIIIEP